MFIFKWRRVLLFLGDSVLFYLALAAALTLRRSLLISLDFFLQHIKIFFPFFFAWAGVFYVLGYYDLRRINKLVNLINDTLLAFGINLAVSISIFYFFSSSFGISPKTHLLLMLIFMHIFTMGWRRLWTRYFLLKVLSQRTAFFGVTPRLEEIKRDLEKNPHLGFTVVPLPDLRVRETQKNGYWIPHRCNGKNLSSKIDLLVVDNDDTHQNPLIESIILSTAVMEGVPVITHLDFYEDLYGKIPPEHAARPSWLFSNVLHKRNTVYVFLKRVMDIVLASLALLVSAPLFFAVFLMLKFSEGWGTPVFFFQKRVGLLGKKFVIWKFRTMVPGADKAGPLHQTSSIDDRITGIGKFLRGIRFDELPQLWNIIKGDMSLVGPRPEWVREIRILERTVPHYHLRHLVSPGLTGWAQVNFCATSSEQDSIEKLHYDLYYLKNMSLALDIGILLRTARRIFLRDSSFGKKSDLLRGEVPGMLRPAVPCAAVNPCK